MVGDGVGVDCELGLGLEGRKGADIVERLVRIGREERESKRVFLKIEFRVGFGGIAIIIGFD